MTWGKGVNEFGRTVWTSDQWTIQKNPGRGGLPATFDLSLGGRPVARVNTLAQAKVLAESEAQ
jgi:hypothetical protein